MLTHVCLILQLKNKPSWHWTIWYFLFFILIQQNYSPILCQLVQVGVQISNIFPGRVSISVDPRLGDYDAIIAKSNALVAILKELDIPQLVAQKIHTNLTLIFSLVQDTSSGLRTSGCSRHFGRVKDWWSARAIQNGIPERLTDQPLSEHPKIELVHRIRAAYTKYGHQTMAADSVK
jgi:transaldolase